MSKSPFSWLRSGLVWFWNALDTGRRTVLNLLFLLVLVALAIALFGGGPKSPGPKTTLVLNLKGHLAEQTSGNARDALMNSVSGADSRKTLQLRDVLSVLETAAKDPDITGAVLLTDELDGGGQVILREVAAALDRFKASGKPVVAWGSSYDQRQYLLAAHASEVYLHPMGMVMLEGFGRYRNYYRDALDKLGVTVNLMRVGTYKSFAEPFIANGPSEAAAEAEAYLNNGLWNAYTTDVEKARKLAQGSVMKTINDLPALVEQQKGDLAKVTLAAKLVDGLKTKDEVREMMVKRGVPDAKGKTFRQIGYDEYLARIRPKLTGDAIGVVVAQGEISDGTASAGSIGGDSTSKLIRAAREDDSIKAVVLRVDSPGGSAFASEVIRRELELTRAAGMPVVVSMGNVAASGGYWISMAADEVIAAPTTITGSIGVFAILPTAEKVIDKVGIHTAGKPTTWLGDATNPLRPLDPRVGQLIQGSINHIYADFIGRAAQARKTTPEKIDGVAQGRVWTGEQAKERGLVDRLGTYGDALKAAASRAKLEDYRVVYMEPDVSKVDRIIGLLGGSAAQAVAQSVAQTLGVQWKQSVTLSTGLPVTAANGIAQDLGWLAELTAARKPFTAVTHCLCESP
ncbi:signal peptide peptidase SppA [Pseudoduganella danionis]|uniref:Signal peptide peptidase SppA n=1 Tax=Pseudoduganella danionis TaxID=1890295 RepID=A0ABW9SPR6_9BURK|nr:signal peptide peptidase SppA [Pseudoduganella danionis]MTW33635.1 signal peptide peptidase SppA [Pseudoduganella danionis]